MKAVTLCVNLSTLCVNMSTLCVNLSTCHESSDPSCELEHMPWKQWPCAWTWAPCVWTWAHAMKAVTMKAVTLRVNLSTCHESSDPVCELEHTPWKQWPCVWTQPLFVLVPHAQLNSPHSATRSAKQMSHCLSWAATNRASTFHTDHSQDQSYHSFVSDLAHLYGTNITADAYPVHPFLSSCFPR